MTSAAVLHRSKEPGGPTSTLSRNSPATFSVPRIACVAAEELLGSAPPASQPHEKFCAQSRAEHRAVTADEGGR
jgi:hypothetical protein